ncbi:MAG: YihY/virulence factor BrkB family protein [Pseudomonadota bacterium]
MIALARIFGQAYHGFMARNGDMLAGYVAYVMLLAIFPFLIFAVSLSGIFIGEARSEEAVAVLFDFAPRYLAEALEPVLVEVLKGSHGIFTVFFALALWAAMRAVEAINRAFDATYGDRGGAVWIIRKAKALIAVFVAAVVAVALGLSILFAPVIVNFVEANTVFRAPENFTLIRYFFGIALFFVFLCALHWFLPNHHAAGFPIWPGAFFSTIAWVAMATGMSVYLAYFGSYDVAYGALAGIVITILFLYFSAAIIIFGAELNAAIKNAGG